MLYLHFAGVAQPAVWKRDNFFFIKTYIGIYIIFWPVPFFLFMLFYFIYLNTLCCNFHSTGKQFTEIRQNIKLKVSWKHVLFELFSNVVSSYFAGFFAYETESTGTHKKQYKHVLNWFVKFNFVFINYWN